ncbi:superoxide dismutase [uncultured Acetobacteroides sp.]|uniref:superoxide dismutase n=1 Tax=uncultured Acetobacteroides sp. TaxID=1760811 RepID=UPI0029F5B5B2|nr:superoxide dismutase [uncultured Acetobacteroides sp.]
MKFELPKLPYEVSALNPSISDRTIEFHYGKHHQAYVNNLNNLVPGTKFEDADLETIIREAEGPIFNNAAQVWNHTFYFNQFSPKPCTHPKGELAKAIDRQFGSFDKLKEEFTKASVGLFGSGWTWLVKNDDGSLDIVPEPNAGTPLRKGKKPILTCDVWEHAYYLDYQNRRPDYVSNFWNILDWDVISDRY